VPCRYAIGGIILSGHRLEARVRVAQVKSSGHLICPECPIQVLRSSLGTTSNLNGEKAIPISVSDDIRVIVYDKTRGD
jgi:hypothetical protein